MLILVVDSQIIQQAKKQGGLKIKIYKRCNLRAFLIGKYNKILLNSLTAFCEFLPLNFDLEI